MKVFRFLWRHKRRIAAILACLFVMLYCALYVLIATMRSPSDEFVLLADGRRLAYQIHEGNPDAVVDVVLVHGNPGDAGQWSRVVGEAGAGAVRRWIAVDRLGYGNSTPGAEVSLAAQADSLRQLIEQVCDRPPLVLGHSYGGPVALRLAVDAPEAVAGLVLASAACDPALPDQRRLRLAINCLAWILPAPLDVCNKELIALTAENESMKPLVGRVRCPVTIVHGTADTLCPYEGNVQYLQSALTGSADVRLVTLQDVGHITHVFHAAELVRETSRLAEK